jgi:hypothetical protein
MKKRMIAGAVAMLAVGAMLSGCEILYFAAGKGKSKPEFTFPKNQRVLVFVDARPGVPMPVEATAALGDRIAAYLYKHNAADHIVAQERLTDLRRNPRFSAMGIADVARQTEADCVLFVDVVQFNIETLADDTTTSGQAQALVKVVDKDGNRMWPMGDGPGTAIAAQASPDLSDKRTPESVTEEMTAQLIVHTGRMFHAYNLEDRSITR